jgi:hypothetical protein
MTSSPRAIKVLAVSTLQRLQQLTDGIYDDLDPVWLPNGRIVFVSTRVELTVRCNFGPKTPQAVMHSMKADGTDQLRISFHETNERYPSVDNDGRLIYMRWDYIDRDFSAAHNLWVCNPDGRDPRSPHGNYPEPNDCGDRPRDGRGDRPFAEYFMRAVPGSQKYMAIASTHHAPPYGIPILIDPTVRDDNKVSQVKVIVPQGLPFPSECGSYTKRGLYQGISFVRIKSDCAYFDSWPLSEMFYLAPWGPIEGGRGGGSEDGLLARRRLLESTRAAHQQEFEALASAEESKRLLEAERDRGTREREDAERRLQEAERGAALAVERESGLTAEKERGARRTTVLEEEIVALRAERAATEAQRAADADAHKDLEEALGRETLALDARRHEMDALRQQADALAARLAEERLARASVRERRRHTAEEVMRLAGEIAEIDEALRLAGEQREESLARAAASDAAGVAARDRLAAHLTAHGEAQGAFASAEEALRACDATSEALEEAARGARSTLEAEREARRQSEMAAAYAESELRHLDERCRTVLDEELDPLLARVPEEPDVDLAVLDAETATLRSKIDAMGPVNLLAIQEFQELEERHAFFEKQEKDLTDAIESLKETIRRINRTSRERFLEAFEAVRANFNETFTLLFGGGRGDIRLMEDEDPLDCGLEINVQPPGKRLQSLMLLSGGEKALSAIALLFAIFRYQPSPFCLLDEVDAALDESNVRRFTRLLQEFAHMTQFIVITHNKRSMEAADTLYGVTMDEPGISKLVSVNLAEGGLAQVRAPERAPARAPRRPRRALVPATP